MSRNLLRTQHSGDRLLPSDFPKIICLCGSTKFYQQFMEANYRFTLEGAIVLSVGFYPHAVNEVHGEGVGITPPQKEALDELHKRKIDLADEVFVINVGGYIGSSTASEIRYALDFCKKISFLEPEKGEDWIKNERSVGV